MGDKFLLTKGSASSLSNGTTDVFAATLGAIGLNPSMPLKTNSFRQLVSTKLDISDINTLGSTLATLAQSTAGVQPPSGTVTDNGLVVFDGTTGDAIKQETGYSIDTDNNKLIVPDISTDTSNSINADLQKIQNFSASTINPSITTIVGELDVAKIKSYAHNCEIELDNNEMTLTADGDITLNSTAGLGTVHINADRAVLNAGTGNLVARSIQSIGGDLEALAPNDVLVTGTDIKLNASNDVKLNTERTVLNDGTGNLVARSIQSIANNTIGGDLEVLANRDCVVSGTDIKLNASNEVKLNAERTVLNAGTGDLLVKNILSTSNNGQNGDLKMVATGDSYILGNDIKLNATNEVQLNARFTLLDGGSGTLIASYIQNAGSSGNVNVIATDTLALQGTDITLSPSGTGQVTCNQTPTTSTSLVNKSYADSLAPKTGTKAEMLALTGMVAGQQFYMNANAGTNFTSQENKMFVWSGRTWQVTGETIEMVCDADMIEGNTLEIGTGADFEVKKTVATESEKCIGVIALKGATLGDWVTVATRGLWQVACEAGTYNRGSYLQTDTIDGLARITTAVSGQPFAKIVENRTTILDGTGVWALLHTQEIY